MQFILVAVAPIILILMIQLLILLTDDKQIGINRIIPYPPNFSNTAARIIEPSRGASTCAFGSHRCVIYMGILTRNAMIMNIIM